MKEEKIPCRIIRYREFPDLLFGTLREDGPVYFDATRFIQAKGDARRHNVRDFRVAFHHWATALADAYGIDREKMIIRDEASGHLLIDECLALLFVVYIDPAFGVYLLERVDELLSGGFTVSDTWLVQAAGLRFTKATFPHRGRHVIFSFQPDFQRVRNMPPAGRCSGHGISRSGAQTSRCRRA